ncbi:hypothetical protein [Paenibacillus spongiae]|uniref:Uncharacterized protein n=1 Tax=Paenibacillus spongiae TaxID=2909671 RepID=A0ABY5SFS5_9BACL|nr:hypothetical protein [Paenibacillus spongiae]UVI32791.1 hypothetical protein L1F29_13580 [Paenibacillus spongiae]
MHIPENYTIKLNTLATSNQLPDVGYFIEQDMPPWVENGKIDGFNSSLQGWKNRKKVGPNSF